MKIRFGQLMTLYITDRCQWINIVGRSVDNYKPGFEGLLKKAIAYAVIKLKELLCFHS
jgi:hypothetical protein